MKKKKNNIILFFKHTKSNVFLSIIYKKKVKFLISSGMMEFKGRSKCAYISIEKLIRKFCHIYFDFLLKLNKSNIKIKTFLFLDLAINFYRLRKPLLLSFWYEDMVIDKIYLKNSLRHGGCKLRKNTIKPIKKKG
jgi:hypothetical protein